MLVITACTGTAGNAGPAKLRVSSSIADGVVLTDPVSWTATVTGVTASDAIARVDFSIDGSIAWTEHNSPYTFNDDGYLLINGVLTPGSHLLAIDAATASGDHAATHATVTTTRPRYPSSCLTRVSSDPGLPAAPRRRATGASSSTSTESLASTTPVGAGRPRHSWQPQTAGSPSTVRRTGSCRSRTEVGSATNLRTSRRCTGSSADQIS